jgi:hypothetical protein
VKLKTSLERDPDNAKAILGAFVARYIGQDAILKLEESDWGKLFRFIAQYEERIAPDQPMKTIIQNVLRNQPTPTAKHRLPRMPFSSHPKRKVYKGRDVFRNQWTNLKKTPSLQSKSI